ncbi:MAG: J domain-containing protein [Spirochaetaceae bacterium]|nr:MAG: J domain-containing protein [Spirochaetaceae bacterium]
MSEDYYDILGVGKDADPDSIRKAYRKEAKKSHPDSSGSENSSARFRKVEEAYETLGDKQKREAYDEQARKRRASAVPLNRQERFTRKPAAEPPPFSPAGESDSSYPFGSAVTSAPLLEVLLSAEEARHGVTVPVDLPFALPCPECSGQGLWRRLFCFTCGGTGSIRNVQRMVLDIPPGIRNGREFLIGSGDRLCRSIRIRVLVE